MLDEKFKQQSQYTQSDITTVRSPNDIHVTSNSRCGCNLIGAELCSSNRTDGG